MKRKIMYAAVYSDCSDVNSASVAALRADHQQT